MRIGILTLPLHTNYGGILQAYALQTVLERMGHEVKVFDRPEYIRKPIFLLPIVYIVRISKKLLGLYKHKINYEKEYNSRNAVKRKYTQQFINSKIHRYVIKQYSDIDEKCFDALVVGSDQIWRSSYMSGLGGIEKAFLSFAEHWNIMRVAYAPSFGVDEWELTPLETRNCAKFLKLFAGVSIREQNGVSFCEDILGYRGVELLLDPTMLLNVEDYKHLFKQTRTEKGEGDLLTYILDDSEEKQRIVRSIANTYNYSTFTVNNPLCEKDDAPLDMICQPSVEKWLQGFYDARFVVTDSFHACVFSILFHVPFVAIGNSQRGMSRFRTLLLTFGLEDRLVCNENELSNGFKDIDWGNIETVLERKRKESLNFINKHLK